MRKFRKDQYLNTDTFQPAARVIMKAEDGSTTVLFDAVLELAKDSNPKYTAQDREDIKLVNGILISKNMDIMTEEEEFSLIDPTGVRFGPYKDVKPEDLQRLAGFEVQKTIKYYDDLKEKNDD